MDHRDPHSPHQIIPGLFLGSYLDAIDIAKLKRLGIGAVLNVAHFENRTRSNYAHQLPGMVYMGIPMEDSESFPIERFFPKTNEFIQANLHKNRNVLVHCMAGVSRSVTVVAAYLMAVEGMQMEEALRLIRSRRPIAGPNHGFLKALQNYGKLLARYFWLQ